MDLYIRMKLVNFLSTHENPAWLYASKCSSSNNVGLHYHQCDLHMIHRETAWGTYESYYLVDSSSASASLLGLILDSGVNFGLWCPQVEVHQFLQFKMGRYSCACPSPPPPTATARCPHPDLNGIALRRCVSWIANWWLSVSLWSEFNNLVCSACAW